MAQPEPFNWMQAIPWILSGASLFWNFLNSLATNRLQRQSKGLDRRIEEFRRLRTNLDTVLSDFIQRRDALSSLVKSAASIINLRKQVEAEQELLVQVYLKLDAALRKVDTSSFATGSDWQDILNSRWDRFNDKLNGIYKPNVTRGEMQTVLASATDILTSIADEVEARLDTEMQQLIKSGS